MHSFLIQSDLSEPHSFPFTESHLSCSSKPHNMFNLRLLGSPACSSKSSCHFRFPWRYFQINLHVPLMTLSIRFFNIYCLGLQNLLPILMPCETREMFTYFAAFYVIIIFHYCQFSSVLHDDKI